MHENFFNADLCTKDCTWSQKWGVQGVIHQALQYVHKKITARFGAVDVPKGLFGLHVRKTAKERRTNSELNLSMSESEKEAESMCSSI